jgi:hypothetical protein
MLGEGGDVLLTQGPSVTRWKWLRGCRRRRGRRGRVDGDVGEKMKKSLLQTLLSSKESRGKRRLSRCITLLR